MTGRDRRHTFFSRETFFPKAFSGARGGGAGGVAGGAVARAAARGAPVHGAGDARVTQAASRLTARRFASLASSFVGVAAIAIGGLMTVAFVF